MATERRLRLLSALALPGMRLDIEQICHVCAELTGTDGAVIVVVGDAAVLGSLGATDVIGVLIEDLHVTLGEGPTADAHRNGRPVVEPDLASPVRSRWVAFGPPAVDAGVGAVFGFPIRIGAARLGVLNLYRNRPGPLTDDQYADALVLADLVGEMILLIQANASPGELAAELEAGASVHYVIHQASGMVSAQLDVTVDHAMVRLRAHAFATGTPLIEIARSVVDRSLRFDPPDMGSTK